MSRVAQRSDARLRMVNAMIYGPKKKQPIAAFTEQQCLVVVFAAEVAVGQFGTAKEAARVSPIRSTGANVIIANAM